MATDPKQAHRKAAIGTPLGPDALVLRSFLMTEELGRLFEVQAEMVSPKHTLPFDDIVGQNATIRLDLPGGATRYFNGYVCRFQQGGPADRGMAEGGRFLYRATLVPWLWFLTRSADCRIFQNKTAPDIIKEIFGKYGDAVFRESLTRTYPEREYCVQYRETDFNFVSRLMEEEGIYYFFEHEDGKHTLVMADAPGAHKAFPKYDSLRYHPRQEGSAAGEYIYEWSLAQEVRPGVYALNDFDFTKTRNCAMGGLRTHFPANLSHAGSDYEYYDYPGGYDQASEGDEYARLRLEELHACRRLASGQTDALGLAVGYTFKLAQHPRSDQNCEHLVALATYQWTGDPYASAQSLNQKEIYTCGFSCIPSNVPYRSARLTPKPLIQGPQTAIVTGKKGEEIETDNFGRVKVKFHWDRYNEYDEKSSCWIRVSQDWAGRKWGAVYLPRMGQEVIVEFLEGDPDRPIITGRVYNDDQMPPYELPAEKTKSTLKSNSSKGGQGFNEIRYEDAKGKEQVFIHAERNMDVRVKNDEMERVIANRHLIVGAEKDGSKSGDQKEMVYRDKHLKVHRNHTEHVGGDMQLRVGGVDGSGNQDIVIDAEKKETIGGKSHLHVKADRMEKVDGGQSLTVGGDQQEKVGMKHAVEAGMEIHLKAGMKVVIEGGMQVTLKGPGGFVDIGPAGVTIQGTMVLINSGGAAGAGSGSSPAAPQDAKKAEPAEPTVADDAASGQKSAWS